MLFKTQEPDSNQRTLLDQSYPHVTALTEKLARNIDTFIQGELQLPAEEMEFVMSCPYCYTAPLQVHSNADIEIARTPGKDFERKILSCKKCNKKVSVTHQVQKALKHGYNRLNKPQPSEAEIDNLIWQTLRKKEASYTKDELDHWMLDFACIQLSVNLHDWRHRKSCFKSGRTSDSGVHSTINHNRRDQSTR
jgi:hypothetical protein